MTGRDMRAWPAKRATKLHVLAGVDGAEVTLTTDETTARVLMEVLRQVGGRPEFHRGRMDEVLGSLEAVIGRDVPAGMEMHGSTFIERRR